MKFLSSYEVTLFWGGASKITVDSDCSHEIKRCLLRGRKVMTNLDSILKSRDITLSTKVHRQQEHCEHIYDFPTLSEELIGEMIAHPYETQSDGCYFVDDWLVMLNEADCSYSWTPWCTKPPLTPGGPWNHSRDHPNTHLSTPGLLSEEYCWSSEPWVSVGREGASGAPVQAYAVYSKLWFF